MNVAIESNHHLFLFQKNINILLAKATKKNILQKDYNQEQNKYYEKGTIAFLFFFFFLIIIIIFKLITVSFFISFSESFFFYLLYTINLIFKINRKRKQNYIYENIFFLIYF